MTTLKKKNQSIPLLLTIIFVANVSFFCALSPSYAGGGLLSHIKQLIDSTSSTFIGEGCNSSDHDKSAIYLMEIGQLSDEMNATVFNSFNVPLSKFDSPQSLMNCVEKMDLLLKQEDFPPSLANNATIGNFYLRAMQLLYQGRGANINKGDRKIDGWYHTYDERVENKGPTAIPELTALLQSKKLDQKNRDHFLAWARALNFDDKATKVKVGFPPNPKFIISRPEIKAKLITLIENAPIRSQSYDTISNTERSQKLNLQDTELSFSPLEMENNRPWGIDPTNAPLMERNFDIVKIKSSPLYPYLAKKSLGEERWKEKILSMEKGEVPLTFKDKAQFQQFIGELKQLFIDHGYNDGHIKLMGTSISFFSYNLLKGIDIHRVAGDPENYHQETDSIHYFDANPMNKSDVDIHLLIPKLSQECHDKGVSGEEDGRVTYFDVATTEDRYLNRVKSAEFVGCGATFLKEFQRRWSEQLGGREVTFSVHILPANITNSKNSDKTFGSHGELSAPFTYNLSTP
ncbi:MAG: hypothetical protein HQK50_05775 [Oligoflexia bacterium]|nr:hypothetical protein [Oligoflexia bacterium]MBF0365059.1 hypothetical protein [Oligoflexia bacterium]